MFKIMVFLAAFSLYSPAIGKIIYVDDSAIGANNGTTWADAYNYLQDALIDANTAEKPVEIRVARGIYKPEQGATINSGDQSATFQLINGVAIYGGYAGVGRPGSDTRDIELYKTIFSGDLDDNDTDVNSPEELELNLNRADNSYQIVTGSGTDETAVLDGFTITGGNAFLFTNRNGAGILIEHGSPQISNCTFIHNSAQYLGGGIYNYYSSPTIVNCTFFQNSAQDKGGGIYNYRSNPALTNCTFSNNSSRYGGGIHSSKSSSELADCTFSNNSARNGGGIYNDDSTATLINCSFTMNLAEDEGGGLYSQDNKPNLNNCTFIENSAEYGGGGMRCNSSDPNLTNCKFIENTAHYGGGMYNSSSNPILTNCILITNSGFTYGGGMYNTSGSLTLNNCIVASNRAYSYGGGMSNNRSDLTVTNCTFTGNSAPNGNTMAFNSKQQRGQSTVGLIDCILWDGDNVIWNNDRSSIVISYSNIQGGFSGEGNIDVDPLFVNPLGPDNIAGTEDDDFRLTSLSPCIDAGDPNYAPGPDKKDFDGNRRIVSDRVDMGAYEFQPTIYVDDDNRLETEQSSRTNEPFQDGTELYPFNDIWKAIDVAKDGYTVLVKPGVYSKIDFMGKAITVAGIEGTVVIDGTTTTRGGGIGRGEHAAVTFHTGERSGSVLKNIVIRENGMAISLNYGSSPTISNITIINNDFGIAAYENSNPDISNCIFWNNTDGDLFQCQARYSCVESGSPGQGNISSDPLFVDGANGDYHLKSEGWRWNTNSESWTWDDVTSRCIDAGDPDSPLADEPMSVPRDPDNIYGVNQRINMGAFGGTAQASLPPSGWDIDIPEDTTAPEPNPAQWALGGEPMEAHRGTGEFDYLALMIALEAIDDSGQVEYFFECTTESAHSSGWQSSNTYSVTIGRSGQNLLFRVKARDLYGNETAWSEELPAKLATRQPIP
jgi:predicted outer membrane repeat protein